MKIRPRCMSYDAHALDVHVDEFSKCHYGFLPHPHSYSYSHSYKYPNPNGIRRTISIRSDDDHSDDDHDDDDENMESLLSLSLLDAKGTAMPSAFCYLRHLDEPPCPVSLYANTSNSKSMSKSKSKSMSKSHGIPLPQSTAMDALSFPYSSSSLLSLVQQQQRSSENQLLRNWNWNHGDNGDADGNGNGRMDGMNVMDDRGEHDHDDYHHDYHHMGEYLEEDASYATSCAKLFTPNLLSHVRVDVPSPLQSELELELENKSEEDNDHHNDGLMLQSSLSLRGGDGHGHGNATTSGSGNGSGNDNENTLQNPICWTDIIMGRTTTTTTQKKIQSSAPSLTSTTSTTTSAESRLQSRYIHDIQTCGTTISARKRRRCRTSASTSASTNANGRQNHCNNDDDDDNGNENENENRHTSTHLNWLESTCCSWSSMYMYRPNRNDNDDGNGDGDGDNHDDNAWNEQHIPLVVDRNRDGDGNKERNIHIDVAEKEYSHLILRHIHSLQGLEYEYEDDYECPHEHEDMYKWMKRDQEGTTRTRTRTKCDTTRTPRTRTCRSSHDHDHDNDHDHDHETGIQCHFHFHAWLNDRKKRWRRQRFFRKCQRMVGERQIYNMYVRSENSMEQNHDDYGIGSSGDSSGGGGGGGGRSNDMDKDTDMNMNMNMVNHHTSSIVNDVSCFLYIDPKMEDDWSSSTRTRTRTCTRSISYSTSKQPQQCNDGDGDGDNYDDGTTKKWPTALDNSRFFPAGYFAIATGTCNGDTCTSTAERSRSFSRSSFISRRSRSMSSTTTTTTQRKSSSIVDDMQGFRSMLSSQTEHGSEIDAYVQRNNVILKDGMRMIMKMKKSEKGDDRNNITINTAAASNQDHPIAAAADVEFILPPIQITPDPPLPAPSQISVHNAARKKKKMDPSSSVQQVTTKLVGENKNVPVPKYEGTCKVPPMLMCNDNVGSLSLLSKRTRRSMRDQIGRSTTTTMKQGGERHPHQHPHPHLSLPLPCTNDTHLRSISTVASPLCVNDGVYLPHIRDDGSDMVQTIVDMTKRLRERERERVLLLHPFGKDSWKTSRKGRGHILNATYPCRPSMQSMRRCRNGFHVPRDAPPFQWNVWKESIAYVEFQEQASSRVDLLEASYVYQHDPAPVLPKQIPTLMEEYEQDLCESVAITGEFLHLTVKSRDHVVALAPETQTVSPPIQQKQEEQEPLIHQPLSPKTPKQDQPRIQSTSPQMLHNQDQPHIQSVSPPPQNNIQEKSDNNISHETCEANSQKMILQDPIIETIAEKEQMNGTSRSDRKKDRERKRRERIEEKQAKKERKRQKKEQKKERKREKKRVQKARKRQKEDANAKNINANGHGHAVKTETDRTTTNSAAAASISHITVPSLHVGVTPMVMTRKKYEVKTITEEVCLTTNAMGTRQEEMKVQQFSNTAEHGHGHGHGHGHEMPVEHDSHRYPFHRHRDQAETASYHTPNNGGHHPPLVRRNLARKENAPNMAEQAAQYQEHYAQQSYPYTDQTRSTIGDGTNQELYHDTNDAPMMEYVEEYPSVEHPTEMRPSSGFRTNEYQVQQLPDNQNTPPIEDERPITRRKFDFNNNGTCHGIDTDTSKSSPFSQTAERRKCASDGYQENEALSHFEATHEIPKSSTIIPILCSEHFLEKASQAAAELSSGRWRYCSESPGGADNDEESRGETKFELCDCDLVDSCGIDIELPVRVGVKILFLSRTFNPKEFTKEVVGIASSSRYDTIHILVVMDVGDANYYLEDLSILQNALVQQRGCPCKKISFQYLSEKSLSFGIVQIIFSCPLYTNNEVNFSLGNELVERIKFLLGLVPSLTVCEGIRLLQRHKNIPFGEMLLSIVHQNGEPGLRDLNRLQIASCLSTGLSRFRVE